MIVVKQLVYRNANAACQTAICTLEIKKNINDYNHLQADIEPLYNSGYIPPVEVNS